MERNLPAPTTRIASFLDRLAATPTTEKTTMWGVCMAEKRVLKGYGYAMTSVRRTLTDYRNAIRARFGDAHPSLEYMRLSLADMEELRNDYRKTIVEQHSSLRPVNCDSLVETATEIVTRAASHVGPMRVSDDAMDVVAALLLLTGRRVTEIIYTGTFSRGEKRHTLTFDGQLKTTGAETAQTDAYTIPVLANPAIILAAIATLRDNVKLTDDRRATESSNAAPVSASLDGLTEAAINRMVNAKYSKYVNAAVKRLFADNNGEAIMPKDLRAVYATTAYAWYGPSKVSPNAYFAAILGHSENDLTTGLSYVKFYPVGQKRAFIADAKWATDAALAQQYDLLEAETDETKRGWIRDKIATLEAVTEAR